MRQATNAYGYRVVRLFKDGRYKCKYIHRLVLEAFVGPAEPGHQGRHLDGTRTNNHLSNLAWGTVSENALDCDRHGRGISSRPMRGENHPNSRLTWGVVEEMRRMYASREANLTDVASLYRISTGHAHYILSGKGWVR